MNECLPGWQRDVELGERSASHSKLPDGRPSGSNRLGVPLLADDHHGTTGASTAGAVGAVAVGSGKFLLPRFRSTLTGVIPSDKQVMFTRMVQHPFLSLIFCVLLLRMR